MKTNKKISLIAASLIAACLIGVVLGQLIASYTWSNVMFVNTTFGLEVREHGVADLLMSFDWGGFNAEEEKFLWIDIKNTGNTMVFICWGNIDLPSGWELRGELLYNSEWYSWQSDPFESPMTETLPNQVREAKIYLKCTTAIAGEAYSFGLNASATN